MRVKDDDTPTTTRTFEVQRHAQGRWVVDTIADDKDCAIELAKELMNSPRPPSGVRVMAVELTDTGKFSEISVFRSTKADQGRDELQPVRPKIEATAKTNTETRELKQSGRPHAPAKAKSSALKNLLRALYTAIGLGSGLAAAEAIRLLMR